MEPCHDQYCNCRNNNLYIHTCNRPVCNNSNFKNHDQPADHANVYCYRSALPKLSGTDASNDIE